MTTDKKIIVKGNELIQDVKYNLEEKELMAFTYACALANKVEEANPNEDLMLSFNISEYNKFFNVKSTGGAAYSHVKEAFDKLMDRKFWIKVNTSLYGSVPVHGVRINPDTQKVEFYLDKAFVPYLVKTKNMSNYTKLDAIEYRTVNGKYSKRIYELLKSHHDKRITAIDKRGEESKQLLPREVKFKISVDSLKQHLGIEDNSINYQYKFLKAKVIKKSIDEIDEKTQYAVSFEEIKEGRRVSEIVFIISKKPLTNQ